MAEPIAAEVLIRQVDGLAPDLREQAGPVAERVSGLLTAQEWARTGTVFVTGDGDSYHAACAAQMAFESLAGVACEPVSALRFAEYAAPRLHLRRSAPLVIAVSASGRTQPVARAARAAREHGALTIAVTGAAGPVTEAADRALVIGLPRRERSPGIRTYQASLLGLLLAAIQLGQARGQHSAEQARSLRSELAGLADAVAATAIGITSTAREVAGLAASSPVIVMAGSGPSYGTALFAAAKMTETAGVFAAGQDLEEWCHVETYASPDAMPVFVVAPPGRSHWRAAGVAAAAQQQGRQVITVTHEDDTEVTRHATVRLPVRGQAREEFSPLLYHVFAGYVASHLAVRLGRLPFRSRPAERG
jgi:glucosamine--fructose-6-phosphate aminotransferase (isomerizing)